MNKANGMPVYLSPVVRPLSGGADGRACVVSLGRTRRFP